MQQPKNITIQVWTDNYYCRVIGIWRPHEEKGAIPDDSTDPTIANKQNLPRYIVLSSVYEPRKEVMGNNPVAPGQHPIPKDFLDDQTRQISYMFANEMGIFTPPSKNHAKTFLANQTLGYKMKKEIKREVSPANGSMNMKELRDSLNQYTDEELEAMPVLVAGENKKDNDKRGLAEFLYSDKTAPMETEKTEEPSQHYLTLTKILPVYELEDPYINNLPIGEDHIEKSLPPGTEDAPMSQEGIDSVTALADENQMNMDALAVADEMAEAEPQPILDDKGEPVLADDGTPMMEEPPEIDRVTVLEELLKKKNKQLEDAGLQEPTISTEKEEIPEPAPAPFDDNGQPTSGGM